MSNVRRSGRISREVPILLLGTDTIGRVFSEKTKTLVLSRHGAGIVSRHKFAPDEALTVRLLGSSREAEVRLVGHIGDREGAHVYGVAFLSENLDFWQMEFPPPEPVPYFETTLECELCGNRAAVHPSDIEMDVYAVNQSLLRFCERCGGSTTWRPARPAEQPTLAESSPAAGMNQKPERSVEQVGVSVDGACETTAKAAARDALPVANPAATAVLDRPFTPELRPATPRLDSPPARRVNRRRDVRTSVRFMACIRHLTAGEDVVECDNISKGGLCFRSWKRYAEEDSIEVAVPYSAGAPAIFVAAQIRHVEEVSPNLFRYGVAYSKAPSPANWRGYA